MSEDKCVAVGLVDEIGLLDKKGIPLPTNKCVHGHTLLRKTWRRLLGFTKEPEEGVVIVASKEGP